MKCNHVNRVPLVLSRGQTVIGGVSVGTCQNEVLPGLVVCFEHATKDTLAMLVSSVLQDYEKATGEPHRYMQAVPPKTRKNHKGK